MNKNVITVRAVKNQLLQCRVCKQKDVNSIASIHRFLQFNEQQKPKALLEKDSLDFENVLFNWLDSIRLKIKPQTYAHYSFLINKHIVSDFKGVAVSNISTNEINDFLYSKFENGRLDGSGGLSCSYIKTIAYIIKSAVNFSVSEGHRKTSLGKIYIPSNVKNQISVFTDSEIKVLEEYLVKNIDLAKSGVLLAINTGLRLGELCGLKWDDVDFKNGTLKVNRTVQRVKKQHLSNVEKRTCLSVGLPKSYNSQREIPLPDFLTEYLAKERVRSQGDYIFSGNSADFVDPRTYQYRFEKYLHECGVRKLNFHALRHTFATRCIKSGVDIKTLSEILGHSNVNISLNVYVHPSLDQKKAQLDLVTNKYSLTYRSVI